MEIKTTPQQGFALLMTLIVVGVVLSIGLSVLELSLKQVRLSTNARNSEIAFHAANAGMECSRYWRRTASTSMENGLSFTPDCFSGTLSNYSDEDATAVSGVTVAGDGDAFRYQYEFTWGRNNDRCTSVNTVVGTTTLPGTGITITGMETLVPGYTDGDVKTCEAGTTCTVISVRGYNRPCSSVGAFGTVEREVLLQF